MRVWRLVRPEFVPGLDGEGARLAGGRWNRRGFAAVYVAESVALAALETFVHLPPEIRTIEDMPELVLIGLDLDDSLVEAADTGIHDIDESQAYGTKWLNERQFLALRVPSIVVPFDTNLMLNPNHPAISGLSVSVQKPFRFDDRMAF